MGTTTRHRGDPESGPRTGLKRSLMRTIRQIPAYLRLLGGLILSLIHI